jgi:hypothetical protein
VQAVMTMIGVGASVTVAVAAFAERRRTRRHDLDAVGFMPWPLISLLATFIALMAFAVALVSS